MLSSWVVRLDILGLRGAEQHDAEGHVDAVSGRGPNGGEPVGHFVERGVETVLQSVALQRVAVAADLDLFDHQRTTGRHGRIDTLFAHGLHADDWLQLHLVAMDTDKALARGGAFGVDGMSAHQSGHTFVAKGGQVHVARDHRDQMVPGQRQGLVGGFQFHELGLDVVVQMQEPSDRLEGKLVALDRCQHFVADLQVPHGFHARGCFHLHVTAEASTAKYVAK